MLSSQTAAVKCHSAGMGTEAGPEASRYAALDWNTPLSAAHAAELIGLLELRAGASVLDLGCGWGELLMRAVETGPSGCTGHGVDTDPELLARGRASAVRRELEDQVTFHTAAAADWTTPADVVICIGAAHAWDDTAAALAELRALVLPGGRLLFGDGCWVARPTPSARKIFGAGVLTFDALIQAAGAAGWRTLHADTADQREWDVFESSWRRGQEQWLIAHPDHPLAAATREQLDARQREYVRDYRDVLGFAYLVLTA